MKALDKGFRESMDLAKAVSVLHDSPKWTLFLLTSWLMTIILHYCTDWLPISPYGLHKGQQISMAQIASAPLFLHNTDSFFSDSLPQQLSLLFLPLSFGKTNGEVTGVVFSFLDFLYVIQSAFVLGSLEFLSRRMWRKHYVKGLVAFGLNLLVLTFIVFSLRIGIGLGSFHLGRNIMPNLCFSDAFREVSNGIMPVLLALYLITESKLKIDENWPLNFCQGRAVMLSDCIFFTLLLPFKFSFWWNMTGIVVGLFVAMLPKRSKDVDYILSPVEPGGSSDIVRKASPRLRVWFRTSLISTIFLFYYYMQMPRALKDSHELDMVGSSLTPLVTFIVMTSPRKAGVDHLTETIQSYLDAFPKTPEDPMYERIKMIVFTHFSEHPVYDTAKERFANDPQAKNYIKWERKGGYTIDQKKHFDYAIRLAAFRMYPTSQYIGIIEDDFPLCPGKWNEVLRLIRDANTYVPSHCALFVGTGGSGLIIKRDRIGAILESMKSSLPVDSAMHYCLKGMTCAGCQIVASPRLLMRHSGNATSTMDHWYYEDVYQCGSRHPFVGDLDAIIL